MITTKYYSTIIYGSASLRTFISSLLSIVLLLLFSSESFVSNNGAVIRMTAAPIGAVVRMDRTASEKTWCYSSFNQEIEWHWRSGKPPRIPSRIFHSSSFRVQPEREPPVLLPEKKIWVNEVFEWILSMADNYVVPLESKQVPRRTALALTCRILRDQNSHEKSPNSVPMTARKAIAVRAATPMDNTRIPRRINLKWNGDCTIDDEFIEPPW